LQGGYIGIVELRSAEGGCPGLGDDDPQGVKLMIDYLYIEEYDPSITPALGSYNPAECKDGRDDIEHALEVAQKAKCHQADSIERSWEAQVAAPVVFPVGPVRPVEDMWRSARDKTKKEVKKGMSWNVALPEPEPESSLSIAIPARGDVSSSFMEMHAKVYAIASKYDNEPLARIARRKLKVQTKCDRNITDLTAAMAVLFSQTPGSELKLGRILKGVMVGLALDVVQDPDFEDAVARIPGLAYDLFR
jgi:hypothetical protein